MLKHFRGYIGTIQARRSRLYPRSSRISRNNTGEYVSPGLLSLSAIDSSHGQGSSSPEDGSRLLGSGPPGPPEGWTKVSVGCVASLGPYINQLQGSLVRSRDALVRDP